MAGRTKRCPEHPVLEGFELLSQTPGTTGGHRRMLLSQFGQFGVLWPLAEDELVLSLYPESAHLPAP